MIGYTTNAQLALFFRSLLSRFILNIVLIETYAQNIFQNIQKMIYTNLLKPSTVLMIF